MIKWRKAEDEAATRMYDGFDKVFLLCGGDLSILPKRKSWQVGKDLLRLYEEYKICECRYRIAKKEWEWVSNYVDLDWHIARTHFIGIWLLDMSVRNILVKKWAGSILSIRGHWYAEFECDYEIAFTFASCCQDCVQNAGGVYWSKQLCWLPIPSMAKFVQRKPTNRWGVKRSKHGECERTTNYCKITVKRDHHLSLFPHLSKWGKKVGWHEWNSWRFTHHLAEIRLCIYYWGQGPIFADGEGQGPQISKFP